MGGVSARADAGQSRLLIDCFTYEYIKRLVERQSDDPTGPSVRGRYCLPSPDVFRDATTAAGRVRRYRYRVGTGRRIVSVTRRRHRRGGLFSGGIVAGLRGRPPIGQGRSNSRSGRGGRFHDQQRKSIPRTNRGTHTTIPIRTRDGGENTSIEGCRRPRREVQNTSIEVCVTSHRVRKSTGLGARSTAIDERRRGDRYPSDSCSTGDEYHEITKYSSCYTESHIDRGVWRESDGRGDTCRRIHTNGVRIRHIDSGVPARGDAG